MTEWINKNKFFVHYTETRTKYTSKGGQFGEWSEALDFKVSGVWSKAHTSYHEEFTLLQKYPSPGTPIFVVVIRYSTGDTFGNSTGHGAIVGCHTEYEYATLQKSYLDKQDWSVAEGTGALYKSWVGYFEHVESIEIITVGFGG